jgi:hypothetical protein
MTVDRKTPTVVNFGPTISGSNYADGVNEEVAALWDRSIVFLTHAGGSVANSIVVTASPTLDAYKKGQAYWFTPAANNTTAVVINIDTKGSRAITLNDGSALSGGELQTSKQVLLVDDGTQLRIQAGANLSTAAATQPVMICAYSLASGSGGGSTVASSRQTYPLQTVTINEIAGASLNGGTNTVTLPAGTYEVFGTAVFRNCVIASLLLRNTTLGADVGVARTVSTENGTGTTGQPTIMGKFTLGATTNLIMQYYVNNPRASDGLGVAQSIASVNEQFGYIQFKKVA